MAENPLWRAALITVIIFCRVLPALGAHASNVMWHDVI